MIDARELVFIPGWGMSGAAFDPLIEALDCDLPTRKLAHPKTNDWKQWPDMLAAQISGAVLCGWSLGAMLSLEIARAHPDRVRALILLAPTPRFRQDESWGHGVSIDSLNTFKDGLSSDPQATLRQFAALQAMGDAASKPLARQLMGMCRPHAGEALNAGLDMLESCDLRPHVPAIAQPVLMIHGTGDRLVPLTAGQWLCARLPNPKRIVLEECGHAPHLSHTRAVAESIASFLRRLA